MKSIICNVGPDIDFEKEWWRRQWDFMTEDEKLNKDWREYLHISFAILFFKISFDVRFPIDFKNDVKIK